MRFYKTNSVHDAGVEVTTEELTERFWSSPEGQAWAADRTEPLDRVALRWIGDNLGQWDHDGTDVPAAFHNSVPARDG